MSERELLTRALNCFISEYADSLARILSACEPTGEILYEQAKALIRPGDDPVEVLLTAYEWRLLIPRRTQKTMQWDDRIFIPREGEIYECPHIIRKLVAIAKKTGEWRPLDAAAMLSKEMSIGPGNSISRLVQRMLELTRNGHIDGTRIRNACKEVGLKDKVDTVISNFKAAGIISPALGYLPQMKKQQGPIYELNPSLIVR